jgi:uncharacterized membrane protein YphA (DoxX/SURF4 family)
MKGMTSDPVPVSELEPVDQAEDGPFWTLFTRVAFRFCFIYFLLFCVTNQVIMSLLPIPIEDLDLADPSSLAPIHNVVFWVASHVFGAKLPLVYTGSGSGDKTFDWVLTFCVLVIAAVATVIWSYFDRKRLSYPRLYKWFRVFMRLALASQMFVYGVDKAVPLQMPFPSLSRLLQPYGNFSPMGVLWSSIGASPAYEIFAGCAELLAGILLIFPRTAVLGALVALMEMIQVFMLNMTYDIPVKLFSFHLVLMSLFLLAPELSRLANFFLRGRLASLSPQPQLFAKPRASRIAVVAQVSFGLWLLGCNIYGSVGAWHKYGGGRPKSPLYGIWTVKQMKVNGEVRPPLLTDDIRWHRIIFDFPERTIFQHMDDKNQWLDTSIDEKSRTISLTKSGEKSFQGKLSYERPSPDRLMLKGEMDKKQIEMELQQMDRNQFVLVSRGFHWISEYPFNR